MGADICTCLTDENEKNEDIINHNTSESIKNSSTKILYLNSLSSNNMNLSLSHRQKLYLNSINLTNEDTLTMNKFKQNLRTNTYIDVLDEEGEIKEIARMLGDESGAESFLENASEIKKQALDYKKSIDI